MAYRKGVIGSAYNVKHDRGKIHSPFDRMNRGTLLKTLDLSQIAFFKMSSRAADSVKKCYTKKPEPRKWNVTSVNR